MNQLVDILGNFHGPVPYLIVFLILLACGFGFPLPEDITLFAAGLLAYYGEANVWWMIIISFIGVMVGDFTMFFMGAKLGRGFIRKNRLFSKLMPSARFIEVSRQFRKRGNMILFFGRFMPGLRSPIFFSAGTLRVRYRFFFLYDGLAALLSVPTIVYGAFFFGDYIDRFRKVVHTVNNGIIFVVLAIGVVVGVRWYQKRKRRLRAPPPAGPSSIESTKA